MNTGKSIIELATELDARKDRKLDYIANTSNMALSHNAQALQLKNPATNQFTELLVNDLAHAQISERLCIPKRYYATMLEEAPDLLAENVNRWFKQTPANRMVRTIDGTARAFLSDRYRRLDNEKIASIVLPALLDSDAGFEVISSEITDGRMYIQARMPRIEGDVKIGDAVQAGLIISNSEVGLGALEISPMVYRLVCLNGMVTGERSEGMRRTHLGGKVLTDELSHAVASDTQVINDRALMEQIRSTINALSDPKRFIELLDEMKLAATGTRIKRPDRAVERLAQLYMLPKIESESILESLLHGGDFTRWGLLNAVTEQANTNANYDRSVELERLGGKVLRMASSDWNKIAEAA